MHPRTTALALLLAACPLDVPETTLATPATSTTTATTDGVSGSISAPDLTADAAPTTTSDTTTEPSDSTSTDPSTGELPTHNCPQVLPAPANCDPIPAVCGNATPIASAPTGYVSSVMLTADHVWFRYSSGIDPCYSGLYRLPKPGGDAEFVRLVDKLVDYEADDEAVYLLEHTDDVYTHTVTALVADDELLLGEVHGDPESNFAWRTRLTRTRAGVVLDESHGDTLPTFSLLTPAGIVLLAAAVEGAILGSRPAHDGQHLYFTWSDPTSDPEPESPLHRRLVRVTGDLSVILAADASDRGSTSVGVDATHVYFATGNLTDGTPDPMSIARVLTTGGPATPLFPATPLRIDQLFVDDTAVYFRDDPADLYAVPHAGGPLRHVWHAELDDDNNPLHLHQDATDLYFAVEGPIHADFPIPGENFIVRIAKATEIP